MEKSITIQIKAKYHTKGELSEKTEQIWFALHGYGQLAAFFIQKFDFLDHEKNYTIAPQGLNKFYLKEFSGRVGANWMTKEDRLNEIANYLNYLNVVYQNELQGIDLQKVKINVLAFSQGCATASRWIAYSHLKFDNFVVWAGEIPQDVIENPIFKTLPLKMVWGRQDELIKPELVAPMLQKIANLGLHPQFIYFEGGHELNEQTLKEMKF
jgi:predicted esterase